MKQRKLVKKHDFLIAIKNTYGELDTNYLIHLRDALTLLIYNNLYDGGSYDRTIEETKGLIEICY